MQAWPADKVERRALSALVLSPQNARTHSPEQVAQLVASIRQWGWTVPVLADEAGVVIAGHGRVMAAIELGLTEVPVMVAVGWTEAQVRAYRIADNQLTLNSGWDIGILSDELRTLKAEWNFDLGLLGFSDIDKLLRGEFLADPDEAPRAPQTPTCAPGEVWLLGLHRLVCGDSTQTPAVTAALNGVRPNLMVTDPPYGVNYDPAWREAAQLAGRGTTAKGKVANDDQADWRAAWQLFPGSVAYVWHSGLQSGVVAASLQACGLKLRAQIVWVKTRPVISRGAYHWQHEPVLYAVQDGADDHWRFVPQHEVAGYAVLEGERADWHGGRKQSTVWFIEHLKSDTGHGTQKPVECMRRPIENNSSPGQAVYDPFVGSGTTVIAAEMTGRVCHAIELDPAYCDVTIARWQRFTGKTATRETDGQPFAPSPESLDEMWKAAPATPNASTQH